MSSYSTLQDHRSMVFDDQRNDKYAKAIKQTVNQDSIVLDLGAGLGLHGLIANQAGAKKVYLVDPSPIINTSSQLVSSKGLSSRIECIQGNIEEITLAEKVDVIVSVFTGNFLLSEDLLPSLIYARDNFLNPGGSLIPDRAVMVVAAVSAPEYYAQCVDSWNKPAQNQSFQLLREYAANSIFHCSAKQHKAELLSKPADLLEMDFMTATDVACHNRIEVEIAANGVCHGWLGWFRIRLGDEWLSTGGDDQQTHWRQVFMPISKPITVKKGQLISFKLDRPEFGEWTWNTRYGSEEQRQSTFLSEPIDQQSLRRKSDQYLPTASAKGLAAKDVLSRLDGSKTTKSIVDYVAGKYTELFPTRKLADRFVKNLINQHGD